MARVAGLKSRALPARFYGDPAAVVDELREARVIEWRKKRRRIKAAMAKVRFGKREGDRR